MPRSGSSSLDRFVEYGEQWFAKKPVFNISREDFFFSSWTTIHEEMNNKKIVSVTGENWETTCLAVAICILTLNVHCEELFGGNPRDEVLKAAKRAAALSAHVEKVVREWKNAPTRDDLFETSPVFLRGLRGLCEGLWWFSSVTKHRPGNGQHPELEAKVYASTMLAICHATYPSHADFLLKCSKLPELGDAMVSALQHVGKAASLEHHAVLSQYYDPSCEFVASFETSWEAAFAHQNEMFNILDEAANEFFDVDISMKIALEECKNRLFALEMTCNSQKENKVVYPAKALPFQNLPKVSIENIW